jgi:hypothetical protein
MRRKSHWKVRRIVNGFNERRKRKFNAVRNQQDANKAEAKVATKEERRATFIQAQINDGDDNLQNRVASSLIKQMERFFLLNTLNGGFEGVNDDGVNDGVNESSFVVVVICQDFVLVWKGVHSELLNGNYSRTRPAQDKARG